MYATVEAAKKIGLSKNCLLRWIAEGLIPDAQRDWRGWRVWSEADIASAKAFRERYHSGPIRRKRRSPALKAGYARAAAESMARCARAWNHERKAES